MNNSFCFIWAGKRYYGNIGRWYRHGGTPTPPGLFKTTAQYTEHMDVMFANHDMQIFLKTLFLASVDHTFSWAQPQAQAPDNVYCQGSAMVHRISYPLEVNEET